MRSASASIAVPSHDQSQGHVHSHSPSVYRRRVISESALPLNAPPLQFPQVDEEQPVTGANGKLDMPEGWTDEDVANYIFRKLLAYEWNPFEKIKKSREMFFDEYESAVSTARRLS
jgi:hypothetical protein